MCACTIAWLRRELRVHDNAVLAEATRRGGAVAVFIYDSQILHALPSRDDRRVVFIRESLEELGRTVAGMGGALICAHGDPAELIPALARDLGAKAVIFSPDTEPYALERDKSVARTLGDSGIEFVPVLDHLVKHQSDVLKEDGYPYRVYTPYARAWKESIARGDLAEHSVLNSGWISQLRDIPAPFQSVNFSLSELGFTEVAPHVDPGERAAQGRLSRFLENIDQYKETRDRPDLDQTSHLSVDLRFGTISVRECFRAARSKGSTGALKWESELIWREFYHMVMANFPDTALGEPFDKSYPNMQWPGTPDSFERWKEGTTGYPIVDAAMRSFSQTGYMHNRLRMVTAMFLSKDLLCDWRWGERYFAEHLIDYDLASNMGGWQWSASVGADAAPYFRIMNPILQSRKCDPNGDFIRKWIPELGKLDSPAIHWPFDEEGRRTLETPPDYPEPIVNHQIQRDRIIQLFQSARAR